MAVIPEPRVLCGGLGFPEGPVYLGRGEVVFAQITGQCVSLYAGGDCSTLAYTGGGPNGATLGADGAIYVANNGGLAMEPDGYWRAPEQFPGRIQRVSMTGEVSDHCARFPHLDRSCRPNDLCFGPDGKLYFTDSANWEDIPNLRPGGLWRTDGTGPAELLIEIPGIPNGIAFGPDPSLLYVAQSGGRRILEIPWSPAGVGTPRTYCRLPEGNHPDGFCFSAAGDLYVCGSRGCAWYVYAPGGELKETVQTPADSEPTNCCLGDGTLYMGLGWRGELIAYDLGVEALPLHGAPANQ